MKLKPCPWCNCGDVLVEREDYRDREYYVTCTNCNARGPHHELGSEAKKVWNERVGLKGFTLR